MDCLERIALRGETEHASIGLTDLRKVKSFEERFEKGLEDAKARH
ncbi:MAG: hypothetical protein ACO0C9_03630 [Candidatus Methanosuratincola verstraetei]|jgi:hypothetical protein